MHTTEKMRTRKESKRKKKTRPASVGKMKGKKEEVRLGGNKPTASGRELLFSFSKPPFSKKLGILKIREF